MVSKSIENKKTNIILKNQIMNGLKGFGKKCKIIVAYEPVWSIGTGLIPATEELLGIVNFIKKKSNSKKVLYGGSVNPKNIREL